ncbi:aminoacyl-tRNA hydrolase [Didymella keratinophila]|nr:aminoacyl-tRNA hydrolase [Didymella keratinophila]
MSNASTRAHVASPTTLAAAPAVADPQNIPATEYLTNGAINRRSGLNKREARKAKKAQQALPTPPDTSSETEAPAQSPAKAPKPRAVNIDESASIPQSLLAAMPPGNPVPLLVCSIGNPGATYANTLHSAGHIITSYIAGRKSYQPFTKGLSGLVARPDNTVLSLSLLKGYSKTQGGPPEDDWTFWQSLSLMNVSGVGVKKAYVLGKMQERERSGLERAAPGVVDALRSIAEK